MNHFLLVNAIFIINVLYLSESVDLLVMNSLLSVSKRCLTPSSLCSIAVSRLIRLIVSKVCGSQTARSANAFLKIKMFVKICRQHAKCVVSALTGLREFDYVLVILEMLPEESQIVRSQLKFVCSKATCVKNERENVF